MTVRDLITYLSALDPNMEVIVDGYEDGYDKIAGKKVIDVIESTNAKWYNGDYTDATPNQPGGTQKVLLSRGTV
jgi:hypothetical protein